MTEKILKEKLRRYRRILKDYESELRRLEELEHMSTSMRSLSDLSERVRSSSSASAKYESVVLDKVTLENELSAVLEEVRSAKEETEALIQLAETREQQLLLRCRYIDGMEFEQIAKVLKFSEQNVYFIHKKALGSILESIRVG